MGKTLEWLADRVQNLLERGDRADWKIGVQTYRCFGSASQLRFEGRVLRDPGLARTSIHDSIWQNFRASFHRFESDEVRRARITANYHACGAEATSDEEGYVKGAIDLPEELAPGWHTVELQIAELPFGKPVAKTFSAECLLPSPKAKFGIISDVDDTVLHTQVRSRLKMVIWSAIRNAYSRLPLPGVSRLYRRLAAVDGESEVNPTFYVSSSPWNLYPVITEFLDAVDLPKGPVLLRDMGIGGGSSMGSSHGHKEKKIARILAAFPRLPFILLGDSGEEDAAIYSRIIAEHPGRVLCAYIRDNGHRDREMLDAAALAASRAGSELILVPDSDAIARHAESHGWL